MRHTRTLLAVAAALLALAATAAEAQARHRVYHPTVGRFMQRDPLGTPNESPLTRNLSSHEFTRRDPDENRQDGHQYEYVSTRPTVATDALGLKEVIPEPESWVSMPALERRCPEGATTCHRRKFLFVWTGAANKDRNHMKLFALRADKDGNYTKLGAHNVGHMLTRLDAHLKKCNCVSHLAIVSHGGISGEGGFRMGSYYTHPQEFVSGGESGKMFADKIKDVMCEGGCTINIVSCSSADANTLSAIAVNTGCTVIGTNATLIPRSDGSWETLKGLTKLIPDGRIGPGKTGVAVTEIPYPDAVKGVGHLPGDDL